MSSEAEWGTRPVYLMVLPVQAWPLPGGRFAAESAFCEHLRGLRRGLVDSFDRIVVASPTMPAEVYERSRGHLGELDPDRDGISHVPLFEAGIDPVRYWAQSPALLATLARAIRGSAVVHTGISADTYRPFELTALLLAAWLGKKTIAVNDIDERRSAWMNWKSGRWSLRPYVTARLVHQPLRGAQLHAAARLCSLVLLKGRKLVEDFGGGRGHVRYFLDAAFSERDLVPDEALERKLAALRDAAAPLETVYFGRLTAYKGVDRCLRAVALAKARGARLRFHVIGAGEEEGALRALATELGLAAEVIFHGALRFGPQLFHEVRACHLLLAAPLSEDTPRSALDAMASGVPILAFDTYYYRELAESGAVELVPWLDVDAFAERIARFAADKASLVERARAAVAFARANTQEIWLERRLLWTRALVRGDDDDDKAAFAREAPGPR